MAEKYRTKGKCLAVFKLSLYSRMIPSCHMYMSSTVPHFASSFLFSSLSLRLPKVPNPAVVSAVLSRDY